MCTFERWAIVRDRNQGNALSSCAATVRALAATGRSRRNRLITAASAPGTGIWTMHFIAMRGFGVSGTEIRYNVPLTMLSLLVAMLVVGAGVFAVGYGRKQGRALAVGGLTTGLGGQARRPQPPRFQPPRSQRPAIWAR